MTTGCRRLPSTSFGVLCSSSTHCIDDLVVERSRPFARSLPGGSRTTLRYPWNVTENCDKIKKMPPRLQLGCSLHNSELGVQSLFCGLKPERVGGFGVVRLPPIRASFGLGPCTALHLHCSEVSVRDSELLQKGVSQSVSV